MARIWFALNAVVVVVALAIQIPITASTEGGFFDTPAARVANLFTFFTILTNILVAATSVLLAVDQRGPSRSMLGPASGPSVLFRTLRLDALLGIIVTAVVYHTVLAALYDLHGAEWFANPFVDVVVLGYPQVVLNCLGVTALFFGLAATAFAVDRLLSRSAPTQRLDPVTGSPP